MDRNDDVGAALPVEVDVDARMHEALVNHVEGPLGWQVTTGGDLPAALRLVSVPVGGHARPDSSGPSVAAPTVLLVRDDDAPADAATAARTADHVVRWPDDRASLAAAAGALTASDRRPANGPTVTFGGVAGGVGTTTVTLAVGGLLAWAGRPTLCVVSGPSPAGELPSVAPAALAGHRTWDAASDVPGVPGLRAVAVTPDAVRGAGAEPPSLVTVPDGTAVLRDVGVAADPDVLVMTRDGAGLRAAATTTAGVVVVVDRGVVRLAALGRELAGRRVLTLPIDVRVGRAGAAGHVPSALPGRWLGSLDPLVRLLGA